MTWGPGGSLSSVAGPQNRRDLQDSQQGPVGPSTKNFMFVLSQEAHISLVGRERRAGSPIGRLLSSFVLGGWGERG